MSRAVGDALTSSCSVVKDAIIDLLEKAQSWTGRFTLRMANLILSPSYHEAPKTCHFAFHS
jgi:hypothetical protein